MMQLQLWKFSSQIQKIVIMMKSAGGGGGVTYSYVHTYTYIYFTATENRRYKCDKSSWKNFKENLKWGRAPPPPTPLYVQGLIVVEQCKSLT